MYDRGAPRFDAMHLSLCAAVEQPPTIDVLVELGENARQIDCAAGPVPCWLKKRAPNEGAAARRSGAKARCAVARSIFRARRQPRQASLAGFAERVPMGFVALWRMAPSGCVREAS